jgi:hypothetical protein
MTEPYPFSISTDEFADKRVLVTGGTRGIDEVTVHLLFATKRGIVPAARVLIDYLAEHFKFRYDKHFKKKRHGTSRSENQKSRPANAT